MKLGARMIKTGLAITMAIYLAMLFNLNTPVFAAIAATFAIQPSIYRSYQTVIEQIQGNVIGAFFAIVGVLLLGNSPFVIGFVVVIVIAVNLKIKVEKTIPLAIVTVIVIMESQTPNFISFALGRFLLIMLGVVSAFLVNLIFMPPKHETKLYYSISNLTDDIIKWMRMINRHASDYSAIKDDIGTMKENSIKMDQLYLLYKEDRTYLKNNQFTKGRKLVLYRQMIHTTKKLLELLRNLHRHENELLCMPEELRELITEQVECLTSYHEQVLLKYTGKIRSQHSTGMLDELCENKSSLMKSFMNYYNEVENDQWMQWFPVFALIIDYSDQLEHLNRLVESFKNHHTDDNELTIKEENIN
ncbi:aromatic acid exporter family protein [Fictibacillus enclensis]|uniref:FUSC family protein n=1 Tax=Fictibacillus enclensis TaxID=1017270 RepID=UPI00259FF2DE|nr:aromatic acid exporter family protein [Fictibacillus enclensis]MDM5197565.1 aromatic acid exporter family protein [Fictibacillus enclensis]MDM5336731.1 aromatic acid exporter family protein [Fictibacillus enclensis]